MLDAQLPLLALQPHFVNVAWALVNVLSGALHVPPYVQLVGLDGALPEPPSPAAYATLNVFAVHVAYIAYDALESHAVFGNVKDCPADVCDPVALPAAHLLNM